MQKLRTVVVALDSGEQLITKKHKVLHAVCGKTVIDRCIDAASACGSEGAVVVLGENGDEVASYIGNRCECVFDAKQLKACFEGYSGDVLVLYGDMPAVTSELLKACHDAHDKGGNGITAFSNGKENRICIYGSEAFYKRCDALNDLSEIMSPDNADVFVCSENSEELSEITDRASVSCLSGYIYMRNAEKVMKSGVTVIDPAATYIGDDAQVGQDTVIEPGCFILGKTKIGSNSIIGPGTRLTDMIVGDNVRIENSVCIESTVSDGVSVGPFAYIRPGSKIGKNVKIGDFVEIKNSVIDEGTKVSHLTYVGDSDVGANVNFGCGTVTCNYDGSKKYRTKIGDNAFIGCNTNLVAPVEVAHNAFTAAGSTITSDVPADSLAIARANQVNKYGWVNSRKEKNK